MTATILPFPRKSLRRQWPETVEAERCTDPVTGLPVYVFEVIARDGRRAGIGMRNDLREALDDIEWLRRGGVRVREIGGPFAVDGSPP